MKRLVIFGNSGSGKSTLSNQLSETESLTHLDLDTLAWLPTTPPTRQLLTESAKNIAEFIASNDNWVIEGCYADLLELAIPAATEMIFMDLPVETCVENARSRPWEPHKYESKAAQDANLEMLVDWIKQYTSRDDTFSHAAHLALYESFSGQKSRRTENQ
tara:strand:+ start:15287 stop:15766 length:480 start_codon:yes stop_codon:yes gene_type:complete